MLRRSTSSVTDRFAYRGAYRMQSRLDSSPSVLEGRWFEPEGYERAEAAVAAVLRCSPLWRGEATVRLRPADVERRGGAFAEGDDALYYADVFVPDPGSEPLPANVLDVSKLRGHWAARRADAARVLGAAPFAALERMAGDVPASAAREYLCHEAGHATGFDIDAKHRAGYFRPAGELVWPLVFVEELRADLMAMGVAAEALEPAEAAGVFAYHLVHRFGLAALSARTGADGAGMVPYLLFCALEDIGLVPLEGVEMERDAVLAAMRACGEHAARELTAPELAADDPVEAAVNAARYYRLRVADSDRAARYDAWLRG